MTLLRCATGEGWNLIMFECAKGKDILYQCNENESYERMIEDGIDPTKWYGPRSCGSNNIAIIFHLVFQIITTQIFLNLFIAVIIDAFAGVTDTAELPVSNYAIYEYQEIWKKFDP